jgi:type II secretory pathway component PulK
MSGHPPNDRRGFALLAVLWILVGVAALGLTIALAGRQAVQAAQNRVDAERAEWQAAGCAEKARAAISEWLIRNRGAPPGPASPWATLDSAVAASPYVQGCEVRLRAVGSALDVNGADEETLRALFRAAGESPETADSLTDALADWRDADGEARPLGAEAEWYAARGRPAPRNGPFADLRELRRVRGFEAREGLDTLLALDSARIDLNHAPLGVLAALPGFGPEAVARVAERRMAGERLASLAAVEASLSPAARLALDQRLPELAGLTTPEPDAWMLEAHGRVGDPPVEAVLELKLVRAVERAAIVRRRTWMR